MNGITCTVDLIIIGTNQTRSDYTDKLTKFMLRGVAKNLPWINQIFLILPSLESVPTGLNLSEFKKMSLNEQKDVITFVYSTFNPAPYKVQYYVEKDGQETVIFETKSKVLNNFSALIWWLTPSVISNA